MHAAYREWLEGAIDTDEAFGVSELVLSGFVRVVTHPRVLSPPEPVESALAFANGVRAAPNAVPVAPGDRHWSIFERLCRESAARATSFPTPTLRRWRSNPGASGSRPIATTRASSASGGVTRSLPDCGLSRSAVRPRRPLRFRIGPDSLRDAVDVVEVRDHLNRVGDRCVVEPVLAELRCVGSSHLGGRECQLPGVVAQRPGTGVDIGLAIVVLGVGRELVWGALGTEVVGVRAPSVVALVRR